MPRQPRFYLQGISAHVIQRGNSLQTVFFSAEDDAIYLVWLKEGVEKHGCALKWGGRLGVESLEERIKVPPPL